MLNSICKQKQTHLGGNTMKKLISLASITSTILMAAPVGATHAETINNNNNATVKYEAPGNNNLQSLYSYFNLPCGSQGSTPTIKQFYPLNNIPSIMVLNKDLQNHTITKEELANILASIKQNPASNCPGNVAPTNPVQTQPSQPVQTQPSKPVQSQPTKPAQSKPSQPASSQKPSTSSTMSAFELKVIDLTNAERAKQGLKPLKADDALGKVARIKAQDMTDEHYFDHTSPKYGSPFDMMKQFGISFSSAAENIAQGQKSPEEVVNAWMNSAGHRANIMNPSLTNIGVGYDSRTNSWSQMFTGK
jgi:uncharacterized YkwD family protein